MKLKTEIISGLKRPKHNRSLQYGINNCNFIYFIRKQQGSSSYLIEIGGSPCTRDDRTGMSYLYGIGYVTSMHFGGEKNILVNKFFNHGRFISFVSLHCMK